MNWAVIVKRVREQHGLKQAAMAELLGVDQATVSRWECGQHIPALSVRNKLARMLAHTNTHNARLDERLADQPDAWVVDGAETLLASAYRRAPVGLCFMDTDLRYVFVNERLAAINGLPVQAHLGRQLAEVLGDLGQRLEPVYRQVLDSGAPIIEMEVSGSVPGYIGPSRYWAVSAYPVMAKGYRRLGLSVAVTDITDRKEVETGLRSVQESLLTAEARFRTVLNLSPAGFLLVKPIRGADDEIVDFQYTFANAAAFRLIGCTAEQLRRDSMLTRYPAHGGPGGLFEHYVHVHETGRSYEIEFIYRADGVVGWFQNTSARVGDEIAITFQDITEKRAGECRPLPKTRDGVTILYRAAYS